MRNFKSYLSLYLSLLVFAGFTYQYSNAAPVYISNFGDFPAYPYNTTAYKQGGAFVGCGPTTGSMIFGYFDHVNASALLTNPGTGVNEGLNTAWSLHGTQYMNTGSDGFGSPYNIEPGLENYSADRGYIVKATIHVSPTYDPGSTAWDAYGSYGDSWLNDGFFWHTDGSNWWIDPDDFCDFVAPKLSIGISIFLTIDTNLDGGGDHWVALVGYDKSAGKYAFYDTYSTTVQWADIHYCGASGPKKDNAISFLRSVEYQGAINQLQPPTNLVALNGYNGAIPLAWKAPSTIPLSIASGNIITSILAISSVQSNIVPQFEMSPDIMQKYNRSVSKRRMVGNSSGLSQMNSTAFLGYNVYRSTSSNGSYTKIGNNISRQYYRDETAVNGVYYYYKVTAMYSEGESNYSNIVNAMAATDGYTISSGWATSAPTMDGVINSSEWSAAVTTDITYPGYTGVVTLYMMNDNDKLYIAVDDGRDDSQENLDQFALFFDEDFNREWPSSAPSGEGIIWIAWDSNASASFSVFGGRYGYWPDNIGLETNVTTPGVTHGISLASGNVQYEGSYDLSASPINASPGDDIGILTFIYDYDPEYFNAFWPQQAVSLETITPNIHGWGTAPFSYGDLKLADSAPKPDISVNPTSWNYGSVTVGSHSDKTFVVKNDGTANLNISSVSVTGDVTQFSLQSGGGSSTLVPGATQNVVVRFNPTSAGSKSATIKVYNNDPDENPLQVNISGIGTVPTFPDISVNPTSWNYGSVTVGSHSDKTFVVRNDGTANLNISTVSVTGDITQFSVQSGGGSSTLTPGAMQNVVVRFNPTSAGSKSAVARIYSNDPDENPLNVNVSGQGIATPILSVNPTTLNFGAAATSLSFQISNNGGGTLTWNVAENPDKLWITSVTPNSGTNNATVNVSVDRSQLTGNSDTGILAVTSNGGNQNISVLIEKEPGTLPEDWDFAANTGNYANVVLPLSANPNIDGVPLVTGDYIGVFTAAGLCCGWKQWQGTNISITVWGDNDQTSGIIDGFVAGELIKYRIYRTSEQTEWDIITVDYSQGDGLYAANAFMVLSQFDATEQVCIALNFNSGWNMFSLNVIPADADIAALMNPIVNKLIIAKNGNGQTYIPAYTINDIGNIEFAEGYQAYMNDSVLLEVCGQPIAPTTPINLPSGWSMISYLPAVPIDAATALASINDVLVIAKNNNGQTYIPLYGINDIGQMQPGQGYQVYLSAAKTLIYPAEGLLKKESTMSNNLQNSSMDSTEHFKFTDNTGENATIVVPIIANPKFSDGSLLKSGDEIGVFSTAGLCCGAVVWDGTTNKAIAVFGDNTQTDSLDGFTAGDTLRFRVWRKTADNEYLTDVSFQSGPIVYQANGLSVVSELIADLESYLNVSDNENKIIPSDFKLLQNYPNPFNPETTIEFYLPQATRVMLTIYEMQGHEIKKLVTNSMSAGYHKVLWDGRDEMGRAVASGMYFYRIKTESYVDAKKCLLMK